MSFKTDIHVMLRTCRQLERLNWAWQTRDEDTTKLNMENVYDRVTISVECVMTVDQALNGVSALLLAVDIIVKKLWLKLTGLDDFELTDGISYSQFDLLTDRGKSGHQLQAAKADLIRQQFYVSSFGQHLDFVSTTIISSSFLGLVFISLFALKMPKALNGSAPI